MNDYFRGPHSDLVYQIVKLSGYKSYLELGIYDGDTFLKVATIVNRVVGVDIKDVRKHKHLGEFHLKTTDEFFKNCNEKFDCIFLDADHTFEQVKIDFNNSILRLNINGLIIIHDTDPANEFYSQKGYCGDSYKMLKWLREQEIFDVVTLPINEAGLTLVRRKIDRRINFLE